MWMMARMDDGNTKVSQPDTGVMFPARAAEVVARAEFAEFAELGANVDRGRRSNVFVL